MRKIEVGEVNRWWTYGLVIYYLFTPPNEIVPVIREVQTVHMHRPIYTHIYETRNLGFPARSLHVPIFVSYCHDVVEARIVLEPRPWCYARRAPIGRQGGICRILADGQAASATPERATFYDVRGWTIERCREFLLLFRRSAMSSDLFGAFSVVAITPTSRGGQPNPFNPCLSFWRRGVRIVLSLALKPLWVYISQSRLLQVKR